MTMKVYLSGEIHTKWREDIVNKCNDLNLDIEFLSPVLNHELSDDIGLKIFGIFNVSFSSVGTLFGVW